MGVAQGWTAVARVRPALRRGMVAAALAVVVMVAGLPAGADSPETGADPTVTLTVNPDDGLVDGQTVTVTGTGFPGNTAGLIRQCAGSVAVPECDTLVSGFFLTDPAGNVPPAPMTVQRVITGFASTYDCGVTACFLVADAGGKSSRHHITFGGATTTAGPPTTAPTTTGGVTTVPPVTTTPPATTVPPPPTTIPPDPPPPTEGVLCVIVRALGEALPSILGGLADFLLQLLGCAPLAAG